MASLKEKLEKARTNLENSIESAEELSTDSEVFEIIETSESMSIPINTEESENVIQLRLLTEDFKFIRETLNENAQNGRRVLRSIASDLMNTDEDMKASLVMSFAELNKAIAENIKLYMVTYKTISEVLKNLQNIDIKNRSKNPPETNPAIDVTPKSTADILEEIRKASSKTND